MWDALLLIVLVIGGIYTGLFSPTEAAAVGAGGALMIAALRGRLSLATLRTGMLETASMTGMIFMILIGATLFNFFLEQSKLTETLLHGIEQAQLSSATVIFALLVFYIVLGSRLSYSSRGLFFGCRDGWALDKRHPATFKFIIRQ